MTLLLSAAWISLQVFGIVAVGIYAWNGNWAHALVIVSSIFFGKFVLGLFEMVALPAVAGGMHFARKGKFGASTATMSLAGLLTRFGYALFSAAILLFYVKNPTLPFWLSVAVAVVVASAPFTDTASSIESDSHPVFVDVLMSVIGVSVSGILLGFGIERAIALAPIAACFSVSVINYLFLWHTVGSRKLHADCGGDFDN